MTKTSTTSKTRTTTRRELQKALRKADLSREEELVLRMRHGIAEPGSAHLEFRGTTDPEIAAKLAYIESDALAHMRPHEPEETDATQMKKSIIDKLKNL